MTNRIITTALISGLAICSSAVMAANRITPSLTSIEVNHGGKQVTIARTADKKATIPAAYIKTAKMCPPFCIQPMQVASGVETVGELELMGYLKRIDNNDRSVMVVDSRTPDWIARGTIPGSVNIPWNQLNIDMSGSFDVETEAETMNKILVEKFGARMTNGSWDFRNAKTLVLFCNGSWCPQSSINIRTLVKLGYPSYKLKWYRGGMQSWVSLGSWWNAELG